MPVPKTPAVDVLGVRIDAQRFETAVDRVVAHVVARERGYVCVTGVHGVMEAQDDPEFADILDGAAMVTADGMPMVWSAKRLGLEAERVYGPDLLKAVVADPRARSFRHYFYGGAPGVAEDLAAAMAQLNPDLEVAGCYSPPYRVLSDEEIVEDCRRIDNSEADLVWVGLSTPKQERWMARARPHLEAPLLLGVGAAYDMLTGRTRQAPRFLQRAGLEWAFRMVTEPRRLAGRYLKNNPRFLLALSARRPRVLDDGR